MTSHAAVVARGMGACCVSGCGDIIMDEENLVNSCFSCRVEEEIIYNDNLNKGYLSYLSLTCEKLHISMRKI